MSASLDDIRARRAQLVARAAVQREEMTAVLQCLAGPLRVVDTATSWMHYLKAHPLVPIVALMGMAFMSARHGIFHLLQRVLIRVFALWRTYRSLGTWITRGQVVWSRIAAMRKTSRKTARPVHPNP